MEMCSAIEAIKALPKSAKLTIYSRQHLSEKRRKRLGKKWRVNGWRTNSCSSVKNQDLWTDFSEAIENWDITWNHVEGHSSC
jgi:ribonuclease HI